MRLKGVSNLVKDLGIKSWIDIVVTCGDYKEMFISIVTHLTSKYKLKILIHLFASQSLYPLWLDFSLTL